MTYYTDEAKAMNAQRVEWARAAADVFAAETMHGAADFGAIKAQEDRADCLADLIGDLMHLAAAEGHDPAEMIRRGAAMYAHEAAPDYQGD